MTDHTEALRAALAAHTETLRAVLSAKTLAAARTIAAEVLGGAATPEPAAPARWSAERFHAVWLSAVALSGGCTVRDPWAEWPVARTYTFVAYHGGKATFRAPAQVRIPAPQYWPDGVWPSCLAGKVAPVPPCAPRSMLRPAQEQDWRFFGLLPTAEDLAAAPREMLEADAAEGERLAREYAAEGKRRGA